MYPSHAGCQWPSRSSKVDDFHFIQKPTCNFLSMINSNLGPISHHLATIHPWRTDGRKTTTTMTTTWPLLKYGELKIAKYKNIAASVVLITWNYLMCSLHRTTERPMEDLRDLFRALYTWIRMLPRMSTSHPVMVSGS